MNDFANLIYDKLANNDNNEQFEPYMVNDMVLIITDNKAPKIAFIKDDTEYVLSFQENKNGEFKIFEN